MINFPDLSEEDVRQLTFGTYRQANSYIREHIDETGQYTIDVSNVESDLIHCRIQSRHTSSTLYNLWIRFTTSAVTSWYCQCKSGARTLGCCAHICSVIWYLGFYRHQCNKIEKERYNQVSTMLDNTRRTMMRKHAVLLDFCIYFHE